MKNLRFAPLACFAAVASLALAATACSGSESAEEPDTDEGEARTAAERCQGTELPQAPRDISELKEAKVWDSCKLKALFESDNAKSLTKQAKLIEGAYDGIPLCRTADIRPLVLNGSLIPSNVRRMGGRALLGVLAASEQFDNGVAGVIWHGKHFTPAKRDGAESLIGDVNNYIDITNQGTNADTHRSAEARYFIDPNEHWLVLDYSTASTGLRVLKEFTRDLVRQVYDTARLVDAEKDLWVGMAYFVNDVTKLPEGQTLSQEEERALSAKRYTPNVPNSTAPSCYFALQKKAAGSAAAP